jgi:Flp pilus assembly protein CpaB
MRRRRPRASGVLLFLSLAMAVAVTLALESHLRRVEARAAAAGPGREVVVATVPLQRGEVAETDALGIRSVPETYLPPGAISTVSEAAGRTLAADVAAGEVLTQNRFAAGGGPVASLVPPGLVALPVTAAFPPGTIVAGDRVDVLATYPSRPFAETVVEGAEVLAVTGADVSEELGTTAASVILLVSRDVAQQLAHARAFADIALAIAAPEEPGT